MLRRKFLSLVSVVCMVTLGVASGVFFDRVEAKEMSIRDRQTQLMKDVNKAQKSNELTDKEAHKMRKRLAQVARKKTKMLRKAKDAGLSTDNKVTLEKDLNAISIEIKKLMLEKRVEAQKAK